MNAYEQARSFLSFHPRKWLITGVAGFIGSNLLEELLNLNQSVVGVDNFITGSKENINLVKLSIPNKLWDNFKFIEGDIRDPEICSMACKEVDFVLHQAALGSVPRSIADPIATNDINISGFLQVLNASRLAGVKRFIYAASSSTYGDSIALPKKEEIIGSPLSPYAVTKLVNEIYAATFFRNYKFPTIGLRYFNVFGKRQNPNGEYSAVIPRWIEKIKNGDRIEIYGDGSTSRDFCYIKNVIQANILAATSQKVGEESQVINIAFGESTTLNELFNIITQGAIKYSGKSYLFTPIYKNFRSGDVKHSLASIEKAVKLLGYKPEYSMREGMDEFLHQILGPQQEK